MGSKRNRLDNSEETDKEKIKQLSTKKFTKHDLVSLTAKTATQKDFLRDYFNQVPIILQDGPAGTGKSFVALYAALSEVFEPNSPYDKVIVLRTPVEGRTQGYLPGDENEKNAAYERPYVAIINELISTYNESYKNLKAVGKYEFYTTGNLRGMTYKNCILILDEAQNADYDELSTIITRIGENCKIVICGDTRQDDLKRRRQESGFEKLKKVLKQMNTDYVSFINYNLRDIVRSGVVKEFLIADYSFTE